MALARIKAFKPEASSIFTGKIVEPNMTLILLSHAAGIRLKMYFKKIFEQLIGIGNFYQKFQFVLKDLSQRQHVLGPFQFSFGIFIDIQ